MRERESLCDILNNVIMTDNNAVSAIFKKELIDPGKLSNATALDILRGSINVKDLDTSALIWIYRAISEINILPDITKYFEELEIKKADKEKEKILHSEFPLIFDAIPLMPKEQYQIVISAKVINQLQLSGVLTIVENMQRESEIVVYNEQLISHVAYNDDRAREISDSLENRDYWSDTIRFHLIKNEIIDYYYDEENKKIIIKNGNLALIDGQHRVRAIEYALIHDPSLQYDFPVILSVGTIKEGRGIIAQLEKRQPINKHTLKTYQNTVANKIITKLEANEDINDIYKFVDTNQKIQVKAGFILKSEVIDAVAKYYSVNKNTTMKEESDITKWLVEFFMEIAYYFETDFKSYINLPVKRWSVNHYIFPAYIWLSSVLRNEHNWQYKLNEILNKIDFNNRPWRHRTKKPDEIIINKFKEVMNNECS